MSLVIATSKQQLVHVGTSTMMGIHDVFPASIAADNNPISVKKMRSSDSQFPTTKTLLGFDLTELIKQYGLKKTNMQFSS